ncbi:alpha-1,2-fucosyltransferase [Pedobacter aquatilis]|uniref:alpha-1,2-fucosyltransferase n=1 Tax=Pedobacter aquatilis TaxID=351343 RepID=UPI00292E4319|nr:alpha-1,2-fucosyltransferase [Pedobacter aquatilis]
MVIVKLQGGLGNQMFQYATAKAIGSKSLYFDVDFLNANRVSDENFTKRELELFIFENINLKITRRFLKYLIRKKLIFLSKSIYQSEKNEFINLKSNKSFSLYLDGYFQNEVYFADIREQLLHDFRFPELSESNKIIADKIKADNNAVAVHIRRGDYLKPAISAYHGILPLNYYEQAKSEIENKVNHPTYYVFSDDIEWCKANLSLIPATFVSNANSKNWEDMYLMHLCRHNIIANSSYSWWSAWLNRNPDKIVIAPKKWFVHNSTEIVPLGWIKL